MTYQEIINLMGGVVAPVVSDYVKEWRRVIADQNAQIIGLVDRIAALENRPPPERGEQGPRGEAGLVGPAGIAGEKGEQGEQGIAGPVGAQGEQGDPGPMGPIGPMGEKGEQGEQGEQGVAGPEGTAGAQGERGHTGCTGAIGPTGEKGDKGDKGDPAAEVDLDALGKTIAATVEEPLKQYLVGELESRISTMLDEIVWPIPPKGMDGAPGIDGKDGHTPTAEEIRPLVEEEIKAQLVLLPKPRDGVGIASVMRDMDRKVHLVLTDGSTREVGLVDGAPGSDGKDGFSLKDFRVEWPDDRTLRLIFDDGEKIQQIDRVLPFLWFRGSWKDDASYRQGDAVNYAGSLFIALCDNPKGENPHASTDWSLAARRGRDGIDGKDGKPGERGPPGADGKHYWQNT